MASQQHRSIPWDFLVKNYWLILAAICVFAFVTRVYRVNAISGYIFDEVYHTITAKLIHRNDLRAYEWWNPPVEPDTAVDWLHPPLAKYTQALGMNVFGETPLGWRISAVLFGTMLVFLVAEFTRFLFEDKRLALLAALLASLDGLLLVMSRIAMNDIHVAFMILLTLFCYAKYRRQLDQALAHAKKRGQDVFFPNRSLTLSLLSVGLTAGAAMGTKWSGVFVLGVVWLWEGALVLTQLPQIAPTRWLQLRAIAQRVVALGLVPIVIYVLSYTHMFLQGKTLICQGNQIEQGKCYCSQTSSWWVNALTTLSGGDGKRWEALEARGGCKRLISHFSELHNQIWWYQTTLKATHNYQSRPLQWFLNLRPVWFYVNYGEATIADIYAQGNPFLFWIGDIFVFMSVGVVMAHALKSLFIWPQPARGARARAVITPTYWQRLSRMISSCTDLSQDIGRLCYVLVAFFAVWLPWQASPRIMFFYHYTPAVPLLAIILSYWLIKLRTHKYGQALLAVSIFSIAAAFVVLYPNWTGIAVPTDFANRVYFAILSWK